MEPSVETTPTSFGLTRETIAPDPSFGGQIDSDKATSEIAYPRSWRLGLVTASLCLGTLLVAIDTTIITVAVPKISTYFKAFEDIQWYGSAYLLTVTAFQPAFGSIYRYFSAKEVYLLSILIFEAGSVLCAAAPSSSVFIVGRAVAGIGAAGLYQGALAVVGLTVELTKRPLYLGIVLSVFGIAVCFGPPLGGVFTDHSSWRWCFWINLPIGAVSTTLVVAFLRIGKQGQVKSLPWQKRLRKLDLLGITAIVGAVTCLILALQWGQQSGHWGQSKVIGAFVGALLLVAAFGFVQWKKENSATIPLRILGQRSIFMGAAYLFFLEMAIYVDLFYIPFYFQSAQLISATSSGVKAMPLGLAQIVAIVVVGAFATRWGYYVPYMVLGQIVAIIGTVLLTRISITTPYPVIAVYLVISGIGFGMGLQMPFTGVQAVLSDDEVPIGNAIMIFFSQLGAAIAIAIAQSVLSTSLQRDITRKLHNPEVGHLDPALVLGAGPTGLKAFTHDPAILKFLQDCYADAVRNTLFVALATAAVAVPFALGMQWLNVKKIDKATRERGNMASRPCNQDLVSDTEKPA
ncbi:permease of the major facilitator superfamily [Lindgomyces ingoldianus]|uniref:Permease of the major facilitator superfamily n=1 Tax=Lindgomyces ingoldianus TaxID=673940 RepID=A0ACB6QB84_9PLEO|nr:permease of the major facilitator superfamily [Lindgomyces ingoldianus]KAF2464156.1 permease of the major facilitator superfamily [Lindgomyces ingoldianus]